MTGMFITLEGPEGAGKSTQCRALVRALRRRGFAVEALRDPGSTALGRALRKVLLHMPHAVPPLTEALLFIGARVALVQERILPALRRGKVVVCDRFHDATLAYQGFGGGLDVDWLDRLGRRAIGQSMPALTLFLDIPIEAGFARMKRKQDRMESKALAFHRRVRNGYRALARRFAQRIVMVDAAQPPEVVRGRILEVVLNKIRDSKCRITWG